MIDRIRELFRQRKIKEQERLIEVLRRPEINAAAQRQNLQIK